MKPLNYLRSIALFLALLIISLPITFAEEFNRVYDANGNLVSDGKYYREYNGLNRLVKVRLGNISTSPLLEEYLWHPIEERIVVKRVYYNGVYNYTVYYPTKEFVRIVNSSGTFDEKYVYQDGVLVAQIDTDGNKQFIHSDHEGSNTLITDINGNVLENTFYSPYGEIISGGKTSRFDYEDKEFDSLTEDYDFGFRKFDLSVPIGNQPDSLIQNVYDPQSLNRYSFERNNPYKYVDKDGHQLDIIILGITVYMLILIAQSVRYMNSFSKLEESYYRIRPDLDPSRNTPAAVLAVSDNVQLSEEAKVHGPRKIGELQPVTASKPQTQSETNCDNQASSYECLNGKSRRNGENQEGDNLPDARGLVNQPNGKDAKSARGTGNNVGTVGRAWSNVVIIGYKSDGTPVYGPSGSICTSCSGGNSAGGGGSSGSGGGSGGNKPDYCNRPGGSKSRFCR